MYKLTTRKRMFKQTRVSPIRESLMAVTKPTRQSRYVHTKLLGRHEKAYMATKAHMDRQLLRATGYYCVCC